MTVYARYLLLILSTRLAAGGWLPPEIASALASDPVVIDHVAAGLGILTTLGWYWMSKARRALKIADILDALGRD